MVHFASPGNRAVPLDNSFIAVPRAIRPASALIEIALLAAGQTLEASIGIIASLTASFETVLEGLRNEELSGALRALSRTAVRVNELGQNHARESARFEQIDGLTRSIGHRIEHMKESLKDVVSLAVNSKIAAAAIRAPGHDFTTFADEIGRTLDGTKQTLNRFAAELQIVRQHVTAARAGQLRFATVQREAAGSITGRLLATVSAIAKRHKSAARSGREVKQGSIRIHARIRDAILALQIGDITRQRLEHTGYALDVAAGTQPPPASLDQVRLEEDEVSIFAAATCRMQAAQITDATRDFDSDVKRITASLGSLAGEARALHGLGTAAYGSADHDSGSFLMDLQEQVGEALGLFEAFETAGIEAEQVTRGVSGATASLCGHLRKVQELEADIRIMGLNTTFRCARIGREGLALSLIAQELRTYANGFAREAGALMREVETIADMTASLTNGNETGRSSMMADEARTMRDAHATLRRMGDMLDLALVDLGRDSHRVVTLLTETVADLGRRNEISQVLTDAAGDLIAGLPRGQASLADMPSRVGQWVEAIAGAYTMATERAVHDRMLGRTSVVTPVSATAPELEDFLF